MEISFDEFKPKRWAPVQRLNEFSQTDRRIAPVPTTSKNLDDYPRTYSQRSLAERNYAARAKTPKPPSDLDDPWNTNYKGKRHVNNPNVGVTWTPADGQVITNDLYGKTDELAGGKTRLQNTAAARHPMMQLYGNIDRVRVDQEESVRPMEHAASVMTPEQIAKEDRDALRFYHSMIPYYKKMAFTQKMSPLVAAFLSPENVALLHMSIETGLQRDLASGPSGEKGTVVKIDFYEDLASGLVKKAMDNHSLPASMLASMNESFVAQEIKNYAPSLRHQERYRRQILEGNNEKYQPYGENDKSVKGEITIDSSTRHLQHPANRFREAYLRATGLGQQ